MACYSQIVPLTLFALCVWFLPGRGMGMPGSGTLNGGTMTGGNAGMAAVGWATL